MSENSDLVKTLLHFANYRSSCCHDSGSGNIFNIYYYQQYPVRHEVCVMLVVSNPCPVPREVCVILTKDMSNTFVANGMHNFYHFTDDEYKYWHLLFEWSFIFGLHCICHHEYSKQLQEHCVLALHALCSLRNEFLQSIFPNNNMIYPNNLKNLASTVQIIYKKTHITTFKASMIFI